MAGVIFSTPFPSPCSCILGKINIIISLNFFFKCASLVTSIDMKEDIIIAKVEFYDHELGREQVVYGEAKASKIERFETNDDSWITLTDSCRAFTVPKMDVLSVSEFKEGEVRYCKGEEKAITSENAKDLVGLSSS